MYLHDTPYFLALLPDVPTTVKLAPNSQSKLVVNQLYSVNGYAVIQAHTQYRNITLSLNPAGNNFSR